MDYLPFARPTIDEAMIAAVADTLRSRWLTTGPRAAAFERALSERFGGRPVRALTSATAAMQVALEVIGVGPGDEVITPAQSFFATANVIERSGATTVFVDVEPRTRNIDLGQAAAAVTPRTRVLLPTHYNAPLDPRRPGRVRARATACAWSRTRRSRSARAAGGRPVGATGDIVSFSFHPNKNMTTIEGGALVLNDEGEAARVEALRFHGIHRLADGTRDVDCPGGKYNFSDVSARLGLEQLAHLDEWCRARERLRAPLFRPAWRATTCSRRSACRRATTRATAGTCSPCCCRSRRSARSRKAFIDAMHREGIGIGVSYEAIHLSTLFRGKGFRPGRFPVSERIARETVTLPLFPEMHEADVERVCAAIGRVLRRKAA